MALTRMNDRLLTRSIKPEQISPAVTTSSAVRAGVV